MKQLSSGILAGLVVFAGVVILGAAQDSRTASRELVLGTFTCAASANGEFNTSLAFEGTTGVFGVPDGMSSSLTTVTTADPVTSCQTLTDNVTALAMSRGCTVGPVREIGFSRDFGMVCPGVRDEVITTVGDLSALVAESLP